MGSSCSAGRRLVGRGGLLGCGLLGCGLLGGGLGCGLLGGGLGCGLAAVDFLVARLWRLRRRRLLRRLLGGPARRLLGALEPPWRGVVGRRRRRRSREERGIDVEQDALAARRWTWGPGQHSGSTAERGADLLLEAVRPGRRSCQREYGAVPWPAAAGSRRWGLRRSVLDPARYGLETLASLARRRSDSFALSRLPRMEALSPHRWAGCLVTVGRSPADE